MRGQTASGFDWENDRGYQKQKRRKRKIGSRGEVAVTQLKIDLVVKK